MNSDSHRARFELILSLASCHAGCVSVKPFEPCIVMQIHMRCMYVQVHCKWCRLLSNVHVYTVCIVSSSNAGCFASTCFRKHCFEALWKESVCSFDRVVCVCVCVVYACVCVATYIHTSSGV